MSLKDPNSKLMKWKIKLDEYNFDIKYKEGKLNTNGDRRIVKDQRIMQIDRYT